MLNAIRQVKRFRIKNHDFIKIITKFKSKAQMTESQINYY